MDSNSPCNDCKHHYGELIEQFLWLDECEEDAPDGVFGSEWGCFRYEKRRDDYE